MKTPTSCLPRKFRHDIGFTLIELLVVIVIIAILAALAFPAFNKVKESGYQAKSVSNLRQLVTAANAYATENDGWYPSANIRNADGSFGSGYWRADPLFTKYLGDPAASQGGTNSSVTRTGYPVNLNASTPGLGSIGYNASDWFWTSGTTTPDWVYNSRGLKAAAITSPTRLFMFAEAVSSIITDLSDTTWTASMDQAGAGNYGVTAYRAAGNTKTIAATYGGNILMLTMAEASKDLRYWRNYLPSSFVAPTP